MCGTSSHVPASQNTNKHLNKYPFSFQVLCLAQNQWIVMACLFLFFIIARCSMSSSFWGDWSLSSCLGFYRALSGTLRTWRVFFSVWSTMNAAHYRLSIFVCVYTSGYGAYIQFVNPFVYMKALISHDILGAVGSQHCSPQPDSGLEACRFQEDKQGRGS